jgi:hypothetical protein
VVAPTGTTATGTKLLPEAKATVGEPHLLVDRRLDWHRARHEGGHITVAWLSKAKGTGQDDPESSHKAAGSTSALQ